MRKKLSRRMLVLLVLLSFVFLNSGVSVYAASLGENLIQPEEGWKRYDDDNTMLVYENMGDIDDGSSYFSKGGIHYSKDTTKKSGVKFQFTGTQFRLLSQCYHDGRNKNVNVYVDGKLYNFSAPQQLIDGYILYYQSPKLAEGEHVVSIEKNKPYSDGNIVMDTIDIHGTLKSYHEEKKSILDIEPEKEKIRVSEEVYANLVIDNINEIAAEDIKITYDSKKLEYLHPEELDGIKLVHKDEKNGELRFILASKGESNIINDKKKLLKLKFKGISTGEALVDIIKGRVSDGIQMEKDLKDEECDEATIIIEAVTDVNNSGEFTLLDLGIDARHLNKDPKSAELTKYNTDIVANDTIDEDDLLEIGKFMIANPNYEPNK
ncbi:MAG: cohesin domain-containing protein [Anaeromicrobium sp.]|uniref:cohesin domain-containing protein n=1 Tax=Anaeromicrobium sp. TaxID=1929132 RepID=UPI0025FD46C6|nr:cohesin domain-containing protein [Anaeromicrobium sp.]MCT4593687.1 cohesin domain-containing protein [Anaeromicrobium sp.]